MTWWLWVATHAAVGFMLYCLGRGVGERDEARRILRQKKENR